ncbi:unnamed protein product [Lepeophtheirus salmonis]|uniref:(salmon louse) hypothetical protein n=1 Tax=Lepeophtheirus salmonis TaxID=72036 RepID=D3PH44_LEPSM|nr:DOMON domain-containing protein CG14681 [Lepeophtheirus salmonis]CAB4054200.1 unnamed protein product [Lepeophtheirus salmonis]CAF2753502.1 unnamed protein product [Lepeophtheirus salmonis]
MRALLILLCAAICSAQHYGQHYGYQNPYKYHPYMRYHDYNARHQEPAPTKEEPEAIQEEETPRYPYAYRHQTQGRHYERPEPTERPTPSSRQPHHYGAYHASQTHRNPYQYHRQHATTKRPEHRKPSPHREQPTKPTKADAKDPKYLGTFKNPTHEVKGDIFMLDDNTLYIQGFSFDGQAPDVYFWSDGVPIPYYTRSDNHITMNVQEYKDEDIVLTLPPEKPTLDKMRKFQIWCKQFGINFGEFSIDD